MAERYQDQYRDRGRRDDRGLVERAGDEVRSWFGDDDAERRRQMDDRDRFRDQSADYRRGYGDRGVSDRGYGYGSGGGDRGWGQGNYRGQEGYRGGQGYGSHDRSDFGRSPSSGGYGSGSSYEPGRGMGYSGRGPKGYQRSDSRINEDVCDRLCDAPDIDASNIEIVVNQGEVTLNGSVDDRDAKRRAEDLVENVSGVREVRNNLRVSRGRDASSTSVAGRSSFAGSGGGGGDVEHPGITGGGPSGATNISTSTATGGAAGVPENPLGLRENADTKTSTAGGRR